MGDTLSSNHIENRENGEELTISEELQNLKDEILTSSKIEPESPIGKMHNQAEFSSSISENILLNSISFNELTDSIVTSQSKSIESEVNWLNTYIEETKNTSVEIGDADIESFAEFRKSKLSTDGFESFISSEQGKYIIWNSISKYINPETNELYPNAPISNNDLGLRLRNVWDIQILKEYYGHIFDEEGNNILNNITGIINNVDSLVGNHLQNGGNDFDTNLINNLEKLTRSYELFFSQQTNSVDIYYNQLAFKDIFAGLLENIINNYAKFAYKNKKVSLKTGEKQIDLQLKSYLFIYGKIFHPELLGKNSAREGYNTDLTEILKIVLYKYNPELEAQIKNKELLAKQKKAEQERRERELKRRQEIAKRNRERNSKLNDESHIQHNKFTTDNTKEDTGAAILKNSNVDLSDFTVGEDNSESFSENSKVKFSAFRNAWNDFIESYDEIKDIVTYSDMIKLYNMQTNNIDEVARKSFLKTDIMKGRTDEEIDQIYKTLQTFPNKFNNAIQNISSRFGERKGEMNNEIKMYALGSVIDNVKLIFADIVEKWKGDSKFEGFLFNSQEPVKREGNDIIISGKFNGTDIKIRYNLISGELLMNSFIQHPSASKITIGDNNNANLKIGQLKSFDTILDEHYHTPSISTDRIDLGRNINRKFHSENNVPGNGRDLSLTEYDNETPTKPTNNMNTKHTITNTNSSSPQLEASRPMIVRSGNIGKYNFESLKKRFGEMLNSNIDLISNSVIEHTKKQSTKNSIVTNFMKTFNIILDGQEAKSIDINDGSNVFNFIQIIENSDSTNLERFQIFMEKIMEYSGLNRGNNNLLGPQRNQKSEITFNENNNNKYISLLRDSSKDFANNLGNLKGKLNFDSDSQLGFIQNIIENITDGTNKPNWKLDETKMNDFIWHLENDDRNIT